MVKIKKEIEHAITTAITDMTLSGLSQIRYEIMEPSIEHRRKINAGISDDEFVLKSSIIIIIPLNDDDFEQKEIIPSVEGDELQMAAIIGKERKTAKTEFLDIKHLIELAGGSGMKEDAALTAIMRLCAQGQFYRPTPTKLKEVRKFE